MPERKTSRIESTGPSVSYILSRKRGRGMEGTPYQPDDEDDPSGYFDYQYYGLRHIPPGPHAPNKSEAKVLRRICSRTGLTPEQVREHKTYRVELAKASKEPSKSKGGDSREWRRVMLSVRARTKAAPWTTEFREAFLEVWEAHSRRAYWRYPLRDTRTGETAYAQWAAAKGFVPAKALQAQKQGEPAATRAAGAF